MRPSKYGYFDNNGNKEICYPYSHVNSIFTKEDESKTLGNYISLNDLNISNMQEILNNSIGNGILFGLEVLPQDNPNMTIKVTDGTILNNGIKKDILGKNLITVAPSDSSKSRKDIVYLDSDLSTIKYTVGDYSIPIAGSETYTIDKNAEAERAGSNTYTITTNFVSAIGGSNTYSLTTNFIANDTVEFNGVTFTAVSSGATGNQFNVGTDATTSMANLSTVLNSNTTINSIYEVVSASNVITVNEKNLGNGNTPSNMTVVGTGVINNGTPIVSKMSDTITFNNIVFTATSSTQNSTNFKVGTDVMETATNFTTTLNANTNITNLYSITSSSNVITITEKVAGGGNTPSSMTYSGVGKLNNGNAITSKENDTVIIDEIIFTAVTNNATDNQFNVGIDINTTVSNLVTTLKANTAINSLYDVTNNNNIITLTEKSAGNGNTPTIATTTGTIKITNGTIIISKTNIPTVPITPNGAFLLAEINVSKSISIIKNEDIIDKRNIIKQLINKQDKINITDSNKISINHNGNCYPLARLLYSDNYMGKTYELKREVDYDNKNNINIYVEDKYIGTNGNLTKISDNEYHMTYNQGIIIAILNYLA